MSIYDTRNEFPGDLCAKLIAGANDTNGNQDAYRVALSSLQDSYQKALDYYDRILADDDGEGWAKRPPLQADAIQSKMMLTYVPTLEYEPRGWTFTGWLTYSATDFQSQFFERDEICRWLTAVGLKSVYLFGPMPAQNTATPAPVVAETPKESRARYLAMFEIEESRGKRGALQRLSDSVGVDRSNLSKKIQKARAEREEEKRAGMWASQLIRDGKR